MKQEITMREKGYTSCRSPNATKEQEQEWHRMVQDLERREQKHGRKQENRGNRWSKGRG